MTVTDNTIVPQGLGDFFKPFGKKDLKYQRDGKNVLRKPGRVLEIGAYVGTAFASPSPEAALSSLTEVINFCHTGKRLNLGKLF